jgi:MFS family permease
MKKRKTGSRLYPWLVPIGFAFIEIATIETILVQSGQWFLPISQELNIPISSLALWITFYSFAMAAAMPFVGKTLSKIDSRIVLTTGIIVAVGAMGLMSTYNHLWQFYVSGVLIGLSGAFVFLVPGPVFINNWFAKRSAFAIGMMGLIMAVGSACISQVCNVMIGAYGWRAAYRIMAAISLAISLPWSLFIIRYKPEEKGMKPYGWEEGMKDIAAEDVTTPGVPSKKAIKTVVFWLLFFACGAGSLYGGYISNWNPAAASWGFSATFGATMISVGTLFKVLFPVIGWLIDKIGAYRVSFIYCCCMMISTLGLLLFHTNGAVILTFVFLFAIQSVNMKMIIPMLVRDTFGRKNFATIYSYVQVGVGVIGAFSAPLIASFYDNTGSYDGAFVFGFLLAVCIITLLITSYFLKRKLVWED